MKLTIPCAYQGGKQRIADKILDIIKPDASVPFVDLCCGTGAVSIALVKRGFPAYQVKRRDTNSCCSVDLQTLTLASSTS